MREELIAVARRRQTRGWLLGVALAIVIMAVVVVIANAIDDHNAAAGQGQDDALWVIAIVVAIPIVAMGVMVGVFFYARARGVRFFQPLLLTGADKPRRKRIVRAVRKGQPLDGEDHELGLQLAQYWLTWSWFQLGLGFVFLLNLIIQITESRWWLAGLMGFVWIQSIVMSQLFRRRAQRFLATGREPSADDAQAT